MNNTKYAVMISISRSDKPGVSVDFTLEDIERANIMKPGYGNGGIAAAVKEYEKFIPLAPPGSRRLLETNPVSGKPIRRRK